MTITLMAPFLGLLTPKRSIEQTSSHTLQPEQRSGITVSFLAIVFLMNLKNRRCHTYRGPTLKSIRPLFLANQRNKVKTKNVRKVIPRKEWKNWLKLNLQNRLCQGGPLRPTPRTEKEAVELIMLRCADPWGITVSKQLGVFLSLPSERDINNLTWHFYTVKCSKGFL